MGILDGRVAIVTGGGSGIGQGVAIRLGREGASVVVDYRGSEDGAMQTVSAIAQAGGKAVAFSADITDEEQERALIEKAFSTFGRCDILVNNAGMEKKADFWDVSEEDFDLVLKVNLRGPFFLTQYFVRKLRESGSTGRIINISSVHEDVAFPGFSPYCVSKGGMRMFMRDLAVELGPLGITINNVAPGAIETPINANLMKDKSKVSKLLENIPLGRLGTVEDVAGIVAFLASDDAAYVNGATFTIDGGLSRSYHEQ